MSKDSLVAMAASAGFSNSRCFYMQLSRLLRVHVLPEYSMKFSLASTSASQPTKVVLPAKREEKAFIEMDTEKLSKYVCINYLKDVIQDQDARSPSRMYVVYRLLYKKGNATNTAHITHAHVDGKDPEITPDSEYPEWLWKMDTKPLPPLEELSEEEHGWIYWREAKKHYLREIRRQRNLGKKYAAVQRNVKVL